MTVPLVREVTGYLLLFWLVFGMSATLDYHSFKRQLKNKSGILLGLLLQFVCLPLFGFAAIKFLRLPYPIGISIIVLTSSPWGSCSNWWCSLFNADLSLSVAITSVSTILSPVMLPLNLYLYGATLYSTKVINNLDWFSIFVNPVIVACALFSGVFCSHQCQSSLFNRFANNIGNLSGIALMIFAVVVFAVNSNNEEETGNLLQRDWKFYVGVAFPMVVGLVTATLITGIQPLRLSKAERFTLCIGASYQNTAIAISVATTTFNGSMLADAIAVPLFSGFLSLVILSVYSIFMWQVGWTRAPSDKTFFLVIRNSFEVDAQSDMELIRFHHDSYHQKKKNSQEFDEGIEIVYSGSGDDDNDEESPVRNRSPAVQERYRYSGHGEGLSDGLDYMKTINESTNNGANISNNTNTIRQRTARDLIFFANRDTHVVDEQTLNAITVEKKISMTNSRARPSFLDPYAFIRNRNKKNGKIDPYQTPPPRRKVKRNRTNDSLLEDGLSLAESSGNLESISGLSLISADDFTDNVSLSGISLVKRNEI